MNFEDTKKKAESEKDVTSMFHLGFMYEFGTDGIEHDEKESFRWYMKAAENGMPEAQQVVGRYYAKNGNDEEAVKWLHKAAKVGEPVAAFLLGDYYLINDDPVKAFKWFHRSADNGFTHAKIRLGNMYRHGLGTKRSIVNAIRWFLSAEKDLNKEAHRHLDELDKELS
jgi:TPR repeat protein